MSPRPQPSVETSGRQLGGRTDTFVGPLQQPRPAPPATVSRERVKKGPKNRISVVDGKPSGTKNRRAYDRSFNQHNGLPAGRRARTGLPAGRGRWHDGGAHLRGARHRAPFAVPARRPALVGGRPLLAGRVPARIDLWLGAGGQARPPAPGGADLTGRAGRRLDACGPGRQASAPRRPASGPAASTPGNGEGAHEVTARDHPAPAPAGLPLRQGRAALLPRRALPRGLSSFPWSQGRPPRPAACRRRAGGGRT